MAAYGDYNISLYTLNKTRESNISYDIDSPVSLVQQITRGSWTDVMLVRMMVEMWANLTLMD